MSWVYSYAQDQKKASNSPELESLLVVGHLFGCQELNPGLPQELRALSSSLSLSSLQPPVASLG